MIGKDSNLTIQLMIHLHHPISLTPPLKTTTVAIQVGKKNGIWNDTVKV